MATNELLATINTETAVPISLHASQVPLDMHPSQLERPSRETKPGDAPAPTLGEVLVDGGVGRGAAGYRAGRKAHAILYSGLSEIVDTHASLLQQIKIGERTADKKPLTVMAIPEEQQAELASAMGTKLGVVTKQVQGCVEAIDQAIGEHDRAVTSSARHPRAQSAEVISEAAAIREYVKSLPPKDRFGWVEARIREGDLMVSHAIAGAESPWSTGLDRKQFEMMRDQARHQFGGNDCIKLDALQTIKTSITKNMERFCKRYLELLPQPRAARPANDKLAKLRGAA